MKSESPIEPKQRVGGRSARVREAVLDAVFAELGEKGYGGLSVDAVARRSHIHKTTIYRRWATREALVIDALDSRSDRDLQIPDTGFLRDDLKKFAEEVTNKLASPQGKAMLKSLVAAVDESPDVLAKVLSFWRERLDAGAILVARGMARGDLPPDTDSDLLVEALLAPIYIRILLTNVAPTPEFMRALIELILAGSSSARLQARADGTDAASVGQESDG